jgi:hypothetical protein
MVMHVCSIAQEIAENCCDGIIRSRRERRLRDETHKVTVRTIETTC